MTSCVKEKRGDEGERGVKRNKEKNTVLQVRTVLFVDRIAIIDGTVLLIGKLPYCSEGATVLLLKVVPFCDIK
jgi:hypothetical protein